jgi:hypothetical protein
MNHKPSLHRIASLIVSILLILVTPAVQAAAPSATTDAATAIGQTTATLNGTVNANGAQTDVKFEWGLSNLYGSSVYSAAQSPIISGSSAVSLAIGGLSCNTLYHFHTFANNGTGGDINGGDLTFTTSACPSGTQTVATNAATAITQTTATLNGTVNANGTSTTTGFEFGLTSLYSTGIGATPSPLSTSVDTPVSAQIGGLSCNTLYHFHAFASNGTYGAQYGSDLTFTTSACTIAPSAAHSIPTLGNVALLLLGLLVFGLGFGMLRAHT